jgi:hypothetical protein
VNSGLPVDISCFSEYFQKIQQSFSGQKGPYQIGGNLIIVEKKRIPIARLFRKSFQQIVEFPVLTVCQ